MHWVDRGPEPKSLAKFRNKYTPKWVEHYSNKNGKKPTDSYWRDYIDRFSQAFSDNCGYCETLCKGEIDHFCPTSKFPNLVYEWTNWIFSCHDCNNSKLHKWPSFGYLDPCTNLPKERPENFFDFDLDTGEILPKKKLNKVKNNQIWQMINDLKLNAFHHLKGRRNFLYLVSLALSQNSGDTQKKDSLIRKINERDFPRSSFLLAWLEKEKLV